MQVCEAFSSRQNGQVLGPCLSSHLAVAGTLTTASRNSVCVVITARAVDAVGVALAADDVSPLLVPTAL